MLDMHEGKQLRELLRQHGKTPSDLARAAKVTPTAVARYLDAAKIGGRAWPTVRQGLAELHIDAGKLRPDDRPQATGLDESALAHLVEGLTRPQLERVREIIKLPAADQAHLMALVFGLMSASKH